MCLHKFGGKYLYNIVKYNRGDKMTIEEHEYISKMLPSVIDQLQLVQECIFNGIEIDVYLYKTLHLSVDALEKISAILEQ